MNLYLSRKVAENKETILRPFKARDVETEGRMVGIALGMQSHTIGMQKSLLQTEFLIMLKQHLRGFPFECCRVSDALDLFLVLSGQKPASMMLYKGPNHQFQMPTKIKVGKYEPIHAKVSDSVQGSRELILSRDLRTIQKVDYILSVKAKHGKLSEEDFRAQGLAFGYPESAVENHVSEQGSQKNRYVRLLIENDMRIFPYLWNATYIPVISGGEVLEMAHLELWNSALAKEAGFLFDIASAHNKLYLMDTLIAAAKGKIAWSEGDGERAIREAVERQYGIPPSFGY